MKGIVLAGGKADPSLCQIYGDIPTALIPIYGKPIIFYIIDQITTLDIFEVYIAVGYKSDRVKLLIDNYYSAKVKINYIDVDYSKKPGTSLYKVLKKIGHGKVYISLADTIIDVNKQLIANGDIVFSSKNFDRSSKWCLISKNKAGHVVHFIEKKPVKNKIKNEALVGIYVLNDISIITKLDFDQINFEISYLLKIYNNSIALKVNLANQWLDFGHLDKYQKSKKRLLEARSFNSLTFDDLLGTITKKSKFKEKLIAEINWQLHLPKYLKVLSPRILDYDIDSENPFITMEYYSYQTMTEIWLYATYNHEILNKIIDKIIDILFLFFNEKRLVSKADYDTIYIKKTEERIKKIIDLNDNKFNLFLNGNENGILEINGKQYKSWKLLKDQIYGKVKDFYNENHNCLIHGDYCFSNLLYDVNSGVLRIIDPRGSWGENENGDIKYDLAKLRHSISGDYDYIVNDLFSYRIIDYKVEYQVFSRKENNLVKLHFDSIISNKFNLKHIKLIEGLLFLSMVPLHSNSKNRQLLMLAKAIELLNLDC
ncbi:sugar phosphate nucleotidyltransferase [Aureibaculum luteum]|uniref:sugar phosphate nucleotidyltransferase n=1 Tax=Aureibaculum luteum TaxID=1548456 RepID=UPI000E53C723|nr:sugar phosphate nucleotidyltransferase [Aureibaculum luteum]